MGKKGRCRGRRWVMGIHSALLTGSQEASQRVPEPQDRQFGTSVRVSSGIPVNRQGAGEEEYPFYLFLKKKIYFGYVVWHMGSQFPNQGSNPHFLQWKL